MYLKRLIAVSALATLAGAGMAETNLPDGFRTADIVILGEIHDNPHHHRIQAEFVAALKPRALVFEMFGPDGAAAIADLDPQDAGALSAALNWDKSGWPDFAMYHAIFIAAPEAAIAGAAVPVADVRASVTDGAAAVFGKDAAQFGLTAPLPADQQSARETLQAHAHCNALPTSLLPGMIEAQRLRDASFARTTLQALAEHGAPVVVIAGSGHARRDWGMPAAITHAAPDVRVASLELAEEGTSATGPARYDARIITPPAERPDPCAAFE